MPVAPDDPWFDLLGDYLAGSGSASCGSYSLGGNKYALHGELAVDTSLANFAESHTLSPAMSGSRSGGEPKPHASAH